MSEGGRSREPVDEATVSTVTLPARRLSGQPCTLPEDAVEWGQALAALQHQALSNPRVAPFREQIALACERTAGAARRRPSGREDGRPV
ncbi:hypothetical protein GCM10010503_38600 [Streptomyces lucensis JCM 4490]|uniref:Uncharacterized protein n=1 Tax=Streptomyces lucensis JCM 4490 TaxID=1306176 RepID=A0A918MS64_9ACTN|nr:hypothetical protein [Streptomyces lucensis]GGW57534.1 hypothetical protein GCM10010503_38600 [Streptomyces lucensis JCM 4490]